MKKMKKGMGGAGKPGGGGGKQVGKTTNVAPALNKANHIHPKNKMGKR